MSYTYPNPPPEIIDHILSEVERTGNAAALLKSCSLVCSSWRHLSQQRIFSCFTIDEPKERCKLVLNCVLGDTNAARLARYIRVLHIVDWKLRRSPGGRLAFPSQNSLIDIDSIVSFLNLLQRVRLLKVFVLSSWDRICLAGNKALIRLFQLPSMITIDLSFKGGLPISILSHFGSNVKEICIRGNGLSCGLSLEEPKNSPKTLLDCKDPRTQSGTQPIILCINKSNALEALTSPQFKDNNLAFFASLRVFSIIWLFFVRLVTDMEHFHSFIESCPQLSRVQIGSFQDGSSIPEAEGGLLFEMGVEFTGQGVSVSISSHATLRIWIIGGDSARACEVFSDSAQTLLRKPTSLSLPSGSSLIVPSDILPLSRLSDVLTSLELYYMTPTYPARGIDILELSNNMWARMDDFLFKHFPKLQKLSVTIDLRSCEDDQVVEVSRIIAGAKRSFPLMSTRVECEKLVNLIHIAEPDFTW